MVVNEKGSNAYGFRNASASSLAKERPLALLFKLDFFSF